MKAKSPTWAISLKWQNFATLVILTIQIRRSTIYNTPRFLKSTWVIDGTFTVQNAWSGIYTSPRSMKYTPILDGTFTIQTTQCENGTRNTAILTKFSINSPSQLVSCIIFHSNQVPSIWVGTWLLWNMEGTWLLRNSQKVETFSFLATFSIESALERFGYNFKQLMKVVSIGSFSPM